MQDAERAKFFEFFKSLDLQWWWLDAQFRKKDGDRGAPCAARFGFRFAVRAERAAEGFAQLEKRLQQREGLRRKYDLVTRESPSRSGARTVLLDDLDGFQVDAVLEWWDGAAVVMETSPNNHQIILVTPEPMDAKLHASVARALAIRFEADCGAAQPGQFHRVPGSLNWKAAIFAGIAPFETKHRLVRGLRSKAWAGMLKELAARPNEHTNSRRRVIRERHSAQTDHSAMAFSWAIRELRAGVSPKTVKETLGRQPWLAHHDATDWPARTVTNALFALGRVPMRYRSSAGAINKKEV